MTEEKVKEGVQSKGRNRKGVRGRREVEKGGRVGGRSMEVV